jgi:hypothetical protein
VGSGQHCRIDSNKAIVFDGAAMNSRLVPDGSVMADICRAIAVCMHRTVVLDVGIAVDYCWGAISSNNGSKPDIGIVPGFRPANYYGCRSNKYVFSDPGIYSFKRNLHAFFSNFEIFIIFTLIQMIE